MISLQTNVTSLFAQEQLQMNSNFESNTIQQLTSGFRINSSGDDAAGLAVANQLQASVVQLQQGRIATYLLYSFVTLVVLLALVL